MSFEQHSILVVDGDKTFADLLVEQMGQLGFSSIHHAIDGIAAINRIDENPCAFDLILCGLDMSSVNGIEFLQSLILREFDGGIVLMGGAGAQFLESVEKLGGLHILRMLGTLNKPVTQQALWKVLAHRIDMPRRRRPDLASVLEVTAEELGDALEEGGLSLCYQPQLDMRTEAIVGVESLVRWDHPRLGLISPVRFVAEAEQHGLIDKLTERVFAASMAQAARWRAEGIFLNLSVNVSMQNLEIASLPDFLSAMAERFDLPPACLTLELNESQLITDPASVLTILSKLRGKGLGLAVEDFGANYTDLEHLSGLPFTELKISRSVVANGRQRPETLARLKNTVSSAKKLGLKVVAEGVETEWHWNLVKSIGCDLAQGYYIAKPMPPSQLVSCLKNWDDITHTIKSAYDEALCASLT